MRLRIPLGPQLDVSDPPQFGKDQKPLHQALSAASDAELLKLPVDPF